MLLEQHDLAGLAQASYLIIDVDTQPPWSSTPDPMSISTSSVRASSS